MKKFLHILLAIIATLPVIAQNRVVEERIVVDIPFHVAKSSESDIHYGLDSMSLVRAYQDLDRIKNDTTIAIKKILFYSSVSPEGSLDLNSRLSKRRIATAERIIRSKLNITDSVEISYKERYIPWHEVLIPALEANKSVPYRDELIKLAYRNPNETGPDTRVRRLRTAQGGAMWEVVRDRYFEYMRKGGAIITVDRTIYEKVEQPVVAVQEEKTAPIAEAAPQEPASTAKKQHAFSVKANAAAVAALIANIGVEIKLAPRWSLDLMGAYSPYNMFVQNRKIRVFGGRPEVRFWWGDVMKRGHFLGLHGFASAFNVQLSDKARYQDPNHVLWGAGLAYGYALPLGKKENWGVEFTLGVGYARIKYDKYDGAKNGPLLERKVVNYFGPTRLGINFSYRFDIEGKTKDKK